MLVLRSEFEYSFGIEGRAPFWGEGADLVALKGMGGNQGMEKKCYAAKGVAYLVLSAWSLGAPVWSHELSAAAFFVAAQGQQEAQGSKSPDSGAKSREPQKAGKHQPGQQAPEGSKAEPPNRPSKQEKPAPKDSKLPKPTAKQPVGSPILTAKLALMADHRLFPYEIAVDVNGQEAKLHGKVSSEKEKAAATEIVRQLEGIKSVVNALEVDSDLRQELTRKRDQTITEYVKERFSRSKTLEAAGFEVKAENGVVSLSGSTRFQVIILEAAQAARQVPGVKAIKVDNVRLEGAP